jgi:hypothetical protein
MFYLNSLRICCLSSYVRFRERGGAWWMAGMGAELPFHRA